MKTEEAIVQNEQLKVLVDNLTKVVTHQEQVIAQLRTQLGQNSSNSHRPPSTDGPKARRERQKRKKKPSKRKRGGQPSRKGTNRRLVAPELVDNVEPCVPDECRHCQAALTGTDAEPQRHQVADVPIIKPLITEYQLHKLTCDKCGKNTRGQLPENVSWSHFGPVASALATTLRADSRLSLERTQKLMAAVFGLKMSLGAISGIDGRTSKLLEADHKALHEAVKNADVAHLDETTWYLAGARQVLWAAITSRAAFLLLQANRGQEQAKTLIGANFKGVAVTDRYCSYHWIDAKRRQMCWAHLVRDFDSIELQGEDLGNGGKLLAIEARAILRRWARVRDGTESRAESVGWVNSKKGYIRALLMGVDRNGGKTKSGGIGREILKHFESLWTYLDVEGVEPTNNAAERALRHPVIIRRLSFGSQSQRGLRFIERVLSVRETLRLQGRHLFGYLVALYQGTPQTLLPSS
jgi:transposase